MRELQLSHLSAKEQLIGSSHNGGKKGTYALKLGHAIESLYKNELKKKNLQVANNNQTDNLSLGNYSASELILPPLDSKNITKQSIKVDSKKNSAGAGEEKKKDVVVPKDCTNISGNDIYIGQQASSAVFQYYLP